MSRTLIIHSQKCLFRVERVKTRSKPFYTLTNEHSKNQTLSYLSGKHAIRLSMSRTLIIHSQKCLFRVERVKTRSKPFYTLTNEHSKNQTLSYLSGKHAIRLSMSRTLIIHSQKCLFRVERVKTR